MTAPTRWTAALLSAGTLTSAACFGLGVLLAAVGRQDLEARPTDAAAIVAGIVAMESWSWSTLGVIVLIATPAAGLVASALESLRAGDREAAVLAVVVLAILGSSVALALAR